MKLARIRVLFLSHSFLPISPIREYWTITLNHVPPPTLSGLLLRAVLFLMNPRNLYGDYMPCEIGKGLLLRIRGDRAEWVKAERGEAIEDYKPPYIEYHFKAVSLGAYDEQTLRGAPPRWGYIEKCWNIIKYTDPDDRYLYAPLKVGIKTWHFAVADGAKLGGKERFQIYEVVKVKFDFPPQYLYGFVLLENDELAYWLSRLSDGWFIDKSRLKTSIAIKVEEIMDEVQLGNVEKGERAIIVIPSLRRPLRPSFSFATALLSKEALQRMRRDISVMKGVLHAEKPSDIDSGGKVLFGGRDGVVYAVDKSWSEYLELAGGV